MSQENAICRVDGSWNDKWNGGIGFIFKKREVLLAYKSARVVVCCALQAEAKALQEAIEYATLNNITPCSFLTDCETLARACQSPHPPLHTDWRAFTEVEQI